MPTAREIALDGSFDWLVLGIGLALLILCIFRIENSKVVMRNLSSDFTSYRFGRKYYFIIYRILTVLI